MTNDSGKGSGSGPGKKLRGISLEDIRAARLTIQDVVRRTSLRPMPLSAKLKIDGLGSQIFLKFENEQSTGSFKLRGAMNKMRSLSDEEKKRGVVASSAGNHAQGVAFGAQKVGVPAFIVMPETAPIVKINATRNYGANVILHGDFYDEAYQKALELEREQNLTFVHPYEDDRVIAGQGTIGLEIFEDLEDVDTVVVPIGGGGLISGIATALKALNPKVKIYGVVSDQAPGMMQLFHRETPSEYKKKIATIAEGIAVKIPSPNVHETYISKLVDEIVAVTDDEVAQAIVYLLENVKTVVEGSGAAGLAAVLSRKLKLGAKTCVLLCGGNIDLNIMSKVVERGLRAESRLARIAVVVDDTPGNLNRLTSIMAQQRANILEVYHDRVSPELGIRETRIDLLVETSSDRHLAEIISELKKLGCRVARSV